METGRAERMLGPCRSVKHRSPEDPGTEEVPEKEPPMLIPFVSSRVTACHRDDLHAEAERARLVGQIRVLRRVSIQKETPMEIEMPTIHRSRTGISAFVAMLL